MAGRLVGLDIGTSSVRAAELTLGKGGATLERFGQVALPTGSVRDGEVIDADVVAEAIRQLWAQAKFTSKKVVVGVANQKVVVRQIDLPWMPGDELKKALAFQVQDHIPMPVEHAILDYHPLEEFTNESGARTLRVLLVAAARDMVGSTLEAVQKAGLSPQMVDLTSFAVLRSMGTSPQGTGLAALESEALIDIGASVTNIVIHQDGVPRFVRILLMGGADLTDVPAVAHRDQRQHRDLAVLGRVQGAEQDVAAAAPPASRSGSTYQSAWVTKLCSGSSRATMSIGSCSEIETRWKAITCSVTETSPKLSSTPATWRCSWIRSM